MKLDEYRSLMDNLHVSDDAVERLIQTAYGMDSQRPSKRITTTLRVALIAAAIAAMTMTVALAVSPTLQETLRSILGIQSQLPEYKEADSQEVFIGADFRVNVLSLTRGQDHAQVFVFVAPFTQEELNDSQWNLVVKSSAGVYPANAEILSIVYEEESSGGIIELDIPDVPDNAHRIELGLSNISDGIPSFTTWFKVDVPPIQYLSISCDTPVYAGDQTGTLRCAQVTLNALSLTFEIPDIQRTHDLAIHKTIADHAAWQTAYQAEQAWKDLLRDYRDVTLHFSDGSTREITCVWNDPDETDRIILSSMWSEDWISIQDVTAITINQHTYPVN